jgi:hypothetical protein
MTERVRPHAFPIFVAAVATLLLTGGSFYGCARTFHMEESSPLNTFFFWSFFVCAAGFAGTVIWGGVSYMRELSYGAKEDE